MAMRASEFARRRARILQRARGRVDFYERAMRHLLRESGATEVRIHGKVVGWALAAGGTVCMKDRYQDQVAANDDLAGIRRHGVGTYLPARAYPCPYCGGWHLTSRAA